MEVLVVVVVVIVYCVVLPTQAPYRSIWVLLIVFRLWIPEILYNMLVFLDVDIVHFCVSHPPGGGVSVRCVRFVWVGWIR